MGLTEMMSLGGGVCCCVSVFLVLVVGLSMLFRPRRPKAEDVAGLAPPPAQGAVVQASLTRMEEEMTVRAPSSRPPAPARPPNPADPLDGGEHGITTILPRDEKKKD